MGRRMSFMHGKALFNGRVYGLLECIAKAGGDGWMDGASTAVVDTSSKKEKG